MLEDPLFEEIQELQDREEEEEEDSRQSASSGLSPRSPTSFSPQDLTFRRQRAGFILVSIFCLCFGFVVFFDDLMNVSDLISQLTRGTYFGKDLTPACSNQGDSSECALIVLSPIMNGLVIFSLFVSTHLISTSVASSCSFSRCPPLKSQRQLVVFALTLFLVLILFFMSLWRSIESFYFFRAFLDFCQILCLIRLCISAGILTFVCETTPGNKVPKLFKFEQIDYSSEDSSCEKSLQAEFVQKDYATIRRIVFAGNVIASAMSLISSIVCLSLFEWGNYWWSSVRIGWISTLPAPLQLILSSYAYAKLWNCPVNPSLTETKWIRLLHYIFYPIIVLVFILVATALAINPFTGDEHRPSFRIIMAIWFVPAFIMALGSLFQLLFIHWEFNGYILLLDLFATESDEFLMVDSILRSPERIRKTLRNLFGVGCVAPFVVIVLAVIDSNLAMDDNSRIDLIISGAVQAGFSLLALFVTFYRTNLTFYLINLICFSLMTIAAVPVFVFNIIAQVFGAMQSESGHSLIVIILIVSTLLDLVLFIQCCLLIYFLATAKYSVRPETSTTSNETL